MTKQEHNVLELLKCNFNLPSETFFKRSMEDYLFRREITKEGFIGEQVPYQYKQYLHWTDFVIYIPDLLDIRIEVKSLNCKSDGSGLSLNPVAEASRMNTIPEKHLIYLLEGEGFGEQTISMINDIKIENMKIMRDKLLLINWINKLKNN